MERSALDKILTHAIKVGASDIHFRTRDKVRFRINGQLRPVTIEQLPELTPDTTEEIARHLIYTPRVKEKVGELENYDCSYGIEGVARFRVHIMRQRGTLMIILRAVPYKVPTFEELGLPPVLSRIAGATRGLILVSGTAGSGKSTTMASMIDHINANRQAHIITLEEPIEFLHESKMGSVTQREIGSDVSDFKVALKAALRQDPDVILIGEMRDPETIDTALTAAETGHLVISTVHSDDVVGTVTRIISSFKEEDTHVIRHRLAESLSAIISQRLVTRKGGKGRVAAVEIMVMNESMRLHILDEAKTNQIRELLEQQRAVYGCQTFEQHLLALVKAGTIDLPAARAAASNVHDFDLKASMLPPSR